MKQIAVVACVLALWACEPPPTYDLLITNAVLFDGSGSPPQRGSLAVQGDTIVALGSLQARGKTEVDAHGMALAPGFINMLSWADNSLLKDGRGLSDLKQGVTLEVMGEGWSPGPRKPKKNDTLWSTLGGYFDYLRQRGVSVNYTSFVGATTVRDLVIGRENRAPTSAELERMKALVAEAMREGAMGLSSSLIYAPADFATTEELIELAKVAATYGGLYASHIRSESDGIYAGLNELFRIAREANLPAEIYHLKINHVRNWNKIDTVLAKIDSAQKAGLKITANMYPYTASATGLLARVPTWVQAGGAAAMRKRLKNARVRQRVLEELRLGIPTKNSDPKDVLVLGFRKDSLNRLYRGKRLDEIARLHGKSSDETTLDLLVADRWNIPCIYFLISEKNLQQMLRQPYVSICSDAYSIAAEGAYLNDLTHPRAYGSFARFLAKYVREEKVMPLEAAVHRLTGLPAANLKLPKRGLLKPGYYADLVLFDPASVHDHATFENAHQYATGVRHVWVNGVAVLCGGEHTGKFPGRPVYGLGYRESRK
jgi:N-acyl-D-amino-acid deacylase